MANERIIDLAAGAALVGTEPFESVQGGISVQVPGSAILALEINIIVSTTTRNLLPSDAGSVLLCTNAAGCAITYPAGLGATFTVGICQRGAAQASVAAGGGATFNANPHGFTKTFGLNSVIFLRAIAADSFIFLGDGA
jgi:hypothetical protein